MREQAESPSDFDFAALRARNAELAAENARLAEAADQAEQKFQTLAETMPVAMFMVRGTEVVYVNPVIEDITGYSREELMSMNWWDVVDPTQKQEVKEQGLAWQDEPDGDDERVAYEAKIIAKDGTEKWLDVAVSLMQMGDDLVVLGTGVDITARRDAEEALKLANLKLDVRVRRRTSELTEVNSELEQQLSELKRAEESLVGMEERALAITKGIPDLVFRLDRNGVFLDYLDHDKQAALLPQKWLGKNIREVLPPDVSKLAMRHIGNALDTGQSQQFEYQLATPLPHGELRDWEGRVVVSGHDEVVLISRDITDNKRSEEALRLAQFGMDRSADSAAWVGQDGHFMYVNDAVCAKLGYTREELLEMSVYDTNPNYGPENWKENWELLKTVGARTFESTHRKRDGTAFPVEVTSNYLEFNGKEYMFSFARDITERKRMEEQLLHSQKMDAIGQLAGGVAHDINNFLTPILGYSHLAVNFNGTDGKLRGYIEEIQRTAQRAATLTKQLMAFSRRQIIEPKVVSVNELVLDMDRMIRRLIGENVELVVLPSAKNGMVKVDPGQFEQLLINFAVNARDAMPNGGRLVIETEDSQLSEFTSKMDFELSPGDYTVVRASDNGAGMTDEVKARVFEPFFTTKAVGKGTGLGLSTCYGIAKQNGGGITVSSEVGVGTTIEVCLPSVTESAAGSDQQDGAAAMPTGMERVLLVEDEPAVCAVAAETLRELGYTVDVANNGDEAMQLVGGSTDALYELVLTDVVMPLMGGKELVRRMSKVWPEVKVLYMSGYADDAAFHEELADRKSSFLHKPFTPAGLAQKVREVLDYS